MITKKPNTVGLKIPGTEEASGQRNRTIYCCVIITDTATIECLAFMFTRSPLATFSQLTFSTIFPLDISVSHSGFLFRFLLSSFGTQPDRQS